MSEETKEGLPLRQHNFARRFGGYFLDRLLPGRMSNIVAKENALIDGVQAAHRSNIFRLKPAPRNVFDGLDADAIIERMRSTDTDADRTAEKLRLAEVQTVFEAKLTERHTIADRFALFIDDEYAKDIYTLDLGETQQPGCHDAVEALKDEYRELLEKLTANGLIDNELKRTDAKRSMHFQKSVDKRYVVGTRNRDLVVFELDGTRKITVAKRMTFLMPSELYYEEHARKQNLMRPRSINRIERLIDEKSEVITPVRTVYYAINKLLDPSQED